MTYALSLQPIMHEVAQNTAMVTTMIIQVNLNMMCVS